MKRHNINHGEADHMNTQYYLADEVDAELERYETARQEDARRLEQVKGEREAAMKLLARADVAFRCDLTQTEAGEYYRLTREDIAAALKDAK